MKIFPPLSTEAIQLHLPTHVFGQYTIYLPRSKSTNAELKLLAAENAPEGTLVIAEDQSAGRGRFDRVWYAPAKSSLLTSLLFRPDFLPAVQLQILTMICALATADAIAAHTGLTVDLKWPNDLVYQNRKLAGLLTEAGFTGETVEWVIVGIGLNVNIDFQTLAALFPTGASLAKTATSLQMILGRPVDRLPLLRAYLSCVEERYYALQNGFSPYQEWAARLVTLGQQVKVTTSGGVLEGLATQADETGALIIQQQNGITTKVLAGDVSLHSNL